MQFTEGLEHSPAYVGRILKHVRLSLSLGKQVLVSESLESDACTQRTAHPPIQHKQRKTNVRRFKITSGPLHSRLRRKKKLVDHRDGFRGKGVRGKGPWSKLRAFWQVDLLPLKTKRRIWFTTCGFCPLPCTQCCCKGRIVWAVWDCKSNWPVKLMPKLTRTTNLQERRTPYGRHFWTPSHVSMSHCLDKFPSCVYSYCLLVWIERVLEPQAAVFLSRRAPFDAFVPLECSFAWDPFYLLVENEFGAQAMKEVPQAQFNLQNVAKCFLGAAFLKRFRDHMLWNQGVRSRTQFWIDLGHMTFVRKTLCWKGFAVHAWNSKAEHSEHLKGVFAFLGFWCFFQLQVCKPDNGWQRNCLDSVCFLPSYSLRAQNAGLSSFKLTGGTPRQACSQTCEYRRHDQTALCCELLFFETLGFDETKHLPADLFKTKH